MIYSTLALIIYLNFARITSNDPECEIFKNKIGSANVNGKKTTPLKVGGVVFFEPETANLVIELHYYDEYFFDPKFQGLTKEDGIDDELTCLDLKLLKFPDNQFNESTQEEITDLTPFASSNETTKLRYLTYIIPGDQLKKKLIVSESINNYIYTGYYAIAYYIQTKVQFTYQFQFSVTVNKAFSAAVDTSFEPCCIIDFIGFCDSLCKANRSSSIEFCINSDCVETTTSPYIYLNENFWLIQKITSVELSQYYLSDSKIYYVGDGLNKAASIEDANYTVPGQAIYKIKATFAWTKLSIQVNSVLKTKAPTRRHLAFYYENNILGESDEFCIFLENGTECPTCDEMIANNPDGNAPEYCEKKSDSSAKMFHLIGLALLSFLF